MDEAVIRKIMSVCPSTRKIFYGVYACDEKIYIPAFKKSVGYIINTGKKGTVGIHWVAIYYNGKDVYYFDSLALSPIFYGDIYYTIQRFRPSRIITVPFRLQGITSSVCGHYCIDFMRCMASGYSFNNFISIFKPYDSFQNDTLVCKRIASDFPFTLQYCFSTL